MLFISVVQSLFQHMNVTGLDILVLRFCEYIVNALVQFLISNSISIVVFLCIKYNGIGLFFVCLVVMFLICCHLETAMYQIFQVSLLNICRQPFYLQTKRDLLFSSRTAYLVSVLIFMLAIILGNIANNIMSVVVKKKAILV